MIVTLQNKKAFTLIELSIVIAIIGLIVAGVVAGKSLVKQAQLRSVISELNSYRTAINAFKMQYNALPGDFGHAYDVWGSACSASASTCNGNDSGIIGDYGSTRQENFMGWTHLALAKLIPGSYTGFSDIFNYAGTMGLNYPASKFTGGGWFISAGGTYFTDNVDSNLVPGQFLELGAPRDISEVEFALFTPAESYGLDLKIDDGKPYTGKAWSLSSNVDTLCLTGAGNDAVYNLSQDGKQCWMWFKL